MANVKKQAKNVKITSSDLHEEINKFAEEWYARAYLDRIKKPGITFAQLSKGKRWLPRTDSNRRPSD